MTAPAARPRSPWVVFVACYLLAGVAAVRVVAGIGDFYAMPEVTRFYADRAGDEAAGQVESFGLLILALFSFLVAAVYLALAILDALGMNPARVITWVVAGLTVVVSAIALLVGGYSGVPWFHDLALWLTAVTLVFAAASVVLLALPAAQRFYRSRRPVPPRPYPGPYARPSLLYPGPSLPYPGPVPPPPGPPRPGPVAPPPGSPGLVPDHAEAGGAIPPETPPNPKP